MSTGPTANYGAFTLLKVFALPAQEMLLTGLRPATTYHFRIKAWDGAGYLSASGDFMFTTASTGLATLLGDQTIQTEHVSLAGGQAAGYQFTAAQSGLASVVHLYLDAGTTASVVRVGLYSDQAGAPGTILAQGSAPGLTTGWISVNIPPVSLVQGQRYWLTVLSPIGGGSVNIRDAGSGGSSLLSRQTDSGSISAGVDRRDPGGQVAAVGVRTASAAIGDADRASGWRHRHRERAALGGGGRRRAD